MEVHRQLGPVFLEAVYQESLALEFKSRGIPFACQVELQINYKNQRLTCTYRADFVCFNSVIVELKATKALTSMDEGQTINYLKATNLERALLINFGRPSLEFKRLIFTNPRKSPKHEQGS